MTQIALLPELEIDLGGAPLTADEVHAIDEVRVSQRLSAPAQCELAFASPPGPLARAAAIATGAAMRVRVRGTETPLFEGQVTAIESVYGPSGEREVRVRGYDALHALRKRQTVRAHVQVTARELAAELTASLGLRVQADRPGPMWQQVVQGEQSDLDLLVELAGRSGLYLVLREGTLHLLTLEGTGTPLPIALGASLLEARAEVNGEPAARRVEATGWNPLRVEAFEARASSPQVGRRVIAGSDPARVGGTGTRVLVDRAVEDPSQAEGLAQSELDRRVAYEVTLWGIAEGDPRLRPGTPVLVAGLDERLCGKYVLTEVTHTIDSRRGFLSELSTAPPAPPKRPAGARAALGVVTRVNDPENRGRVRVSLPAYRDVESPWLHVLSAGAGEGKGLVILPDRGDHVLVLLPGGDPSLGVVLGALYGMRGPHDSGVEGEAVRRYTLRTPGGQQVQLDDARNLIRLEDREGSYIEFGPDGFQLHAAVDLLLEAPGRQIVVRGSQIDMQKG